MKVDILITLIVLNLLGNRVSTVSSLGQQPPLMFIKPLVGYRNLLTWKGSIKNK